MQRWHDPDRTVEEMLNPQFGMVLVHAVQFFGPLSGRTSNEFRYIFEIIERCVSLARARHIEIPSKAIQVYINYGGVVLLGFLAISNNGEDVGRLTHMGLGFHRMIPTQDTINTIRHVPSIGTFIDLYPPFHDDFRLVTESTERPQERYCLIGTTVQTWMERIYGGPHALEGGYEIEWDLVPLEECTCLLHRHTK